MTATTAKLTAIRDRIRALRAKASDSAATEAEAQEAASMAAKLLTKYDIAEAELGEDAEREGVEYGATRPAPTLHPVYEWTAVSIARLTETKCYVATRDTGDGREKVIRFAGMPADVEMATYLAEMLRGAADRGWMQAFMDQPMKGTAGKRLTMDQFKVGFFQGFARRISERLDELAIARSQAQMQARAASGSRALVTGKSALIAAKMREDGITIGGKHRGTTATGSNAGYGAGQDAGSRIGLGRPVGSSGSRQPMQLGH